LSALPVDLQIQTFVELSNSDHARLQAVCKQFRDLIRGEYFKINK
jgi:hypothetical protein